MLYLNHIVNPNGHQARSWEVTYAIGQILEIAKELPEGQGLEIGYYWSWFMVGISILNDCETEALLRRKLSFDTRSSIYVSTNHVKVCG